jgi:hypothetical protein
VADVGVELAVALDHFGEARRIVVERLGELADFVAGEMRTQEFGLPLRLIARTRRARSATGLITRADNQKPITSERTANSETIGGDRGEQLAFAELLRAQSYQRYAQ